MARCKHNYCKRYKKCQKAYKKAYLKTDKYKAYKKAYQKTRCDKIRHEIIMAELARLKGSK